MRRLTLIEQLLVLAAFVVAATWVCIAAVGYEIISWFGRKL